MDVKAIEPNLEILKKPLNHKRKPKPLSNKQKKRLEPSYVPPPQPKRFIPYDSVKRVPTVMNNRIRHIRYYNRQVRYFTKWQYLKLGLSKVCTHCGVEKAYSFFDRTNDPKKSKITRRSYCSDCRMEINRAYYQKNKDKYKKTNAEYYAKHKEKLKVVMRSNYERRKYGINPIK